MTEFDLKKMRAYHAGMLTADRREALKRAAVFVSNNGIISQWDSADAQRRDAKILQDLSEDLKPAWEATKERIEAIEAGARYVEWGHAQTGAAKAHITALRDMLGEIK